MNYLFDPIRNKDISLQPEEVVRQDLLKKMINKLGYPKHLLRVEADLASMVHLNKKKEKLPKRRIDILCFGQNIVTDFSLYPLLIIECKAEKIENKAIMQVKGYNYYLNAFFFAVANSSEIKTFWYNKKEKKYESVNFLPTYNQLLQAIK